MGHSKSSLFLMELIISILFFSLASTVCIQLFVRSHTLSGDTVALNNAIIQAQNIAEIYNHSDGELTSVLSYYPDAAINELSDSVYIYYDENWNTEGITEDNSVYMAQVTSGSVDTENNIHATIQIGYTGSDDIYVLELMHHIAYTPEDIINE
jgi:hypothetical protein